MSEGKSKMTLLLELKNKLFNSKLAETQRKFKKTTEKLKGNLNKLKKNHLAAFTAMRNEIPLFGRAMDLLGNPYVMVAAGAIALGVIFSKGFTEAKKFNHEFLQVKNLNLDKSKQQLSSYKELIRDTAFSTGQDLSKTTASFYDIQSALGVYGNDAKKIFTQVSKFSMATGADLNDSINASVKAMKAFNLTSGDLTMLLESNAKTVQVGITTFKELAQVQTEYAGAAMGAGQDVNTANKIFAAFTSIAKDSRTAATMTKTAFMGLTQKSTIKGLKSIGISMYDATGNMRNLDGVLRDVSEKFKGMSPKQIDTLINKIGGPEGLRNLFVKLKTGAGDFFKTMDAFDSSKFDLEKALKNAQGDFTVLSGIVKNRFNTIMSKLGEKTLPVAARIFEKINKMLEWSYKNWDAVSSAVKTGISVITGLFVIKKIIVLYKAWKAVQFALNVTMLASPIGILVIGIAAAAAAFYLLKNRTKKVSIEQKILNSVYLEANRMVVEQKVRLGRLLIVARDIKRPLVERKKAMKAINNLSPEFLGSLKLEEINTLKATAAIDLYVKSLEKKARAQAITNKLTEIESKLIDVEFKKKLSLEASLTEYRKKIKDPNIIRLQKEKPEFFEGWAEKQKKMAGHRVSKDVRKISELERQKMALLGLLKEDKTLLPDEEGGGDFNFKGGSTNQDITETVNKATQQRSITVNIDALNKGGINTQNTTLQHKSTEEIEEWFNESMMRVIRNIERGT